MIISQVTQETLDFIYQNKTFNKQWDEILDEKIQIEPYINEYFILQSPTKGSAVVRYLGDDNFKLINPKLQIDNTIKAKDLEQLVLMDLLMDDSVQIVTVTGPPGAGKTFLSLAYAGLRVLSEKQMNLICTKPTETVKNSKFFGPVPGTVDEKFAIFLESFDLAMRKILHDDSQYQLMKGNKKVSFKPIEFCRGDSRENTILICDESQNMSWHEVKSLVSRFGENCKVILLGDLRQKDVRGSEKSGFEVMFESRTFKGSPITGHVRLVNDYRGPISRLISTISEEIE